MRPHNFVHKQVNPFRSILFCTQCGAVSWDETRPCAANDEAYVQIPQPCPATDDGTPVATGGTPPTIFGMADGYEPERIDVAEAKRAARLKGYEPDSCPNCMAFTLVRNGDTLTCDSCQEKL